MNLFLVFILFLLIAFYLLDVVINVLNVRHISLIVPNEFQSLYDNEKYARSQAYLKESTRFSLIQKTVLLPILIAFIVLGGFNWVDLWVRGFGYSEIVTGLLFIAVLSVLEKIISMPFSIYQTFVIEQKFGFNQTTIRTYT